MSPRSTRPDYSCADCAVDIDRMCEYAYMVTSKVWKLSLQIARRQGKRASTFDRLCVGCLEMRLGRILTSEDFDWAAKLTWMENAHRSERLVKRLGPGKLVEAQLADGKPAKKVRAPEPHG